MQGPRRLLLIVAVLAVVTAACSSGKGGSSATPSATSSAPTVSEAEHESTVSLQLKEFSITPQTSSAPTREVTFKATNDGKVAHELVVIRTDKAPGALPVAKCPKSTSLRAHQGSSLGSRCPARCGSGRGSRGSWAQWPLPGPSQPGSIGASASRHKARQAKLAEETVRWPGSSARPEEAMRIQTPPWLVAGPPTAAASTSRSVG